MSIEITAKDILETGNIRAFEEYLVANSDKIDIHYRFDDQETFLILLVQTFRNAESSLIIDRSLQLPVDDYKNCMAFLVEISCDLNGQDNLGRTVAHWSVILQCLELLGAALRLGCDPTIQDNEGQTIVHLAIRYSNTMALETIKLYADEKDNVFECASQSSGATPLIYAVQIGATDIVKKLLQLSVNVDSQENNRYKRTALHYALFTENEDIFELLLKHKAKSDIKDYKDKSVIDRVAEHPKDSFLRILTHYSSSDLFSSAMNEKSGPGYSPILTACKNNDNVMLNELIKNEKTEKGSVNLLIFDSEKRSPLHYCSDNLDVACAETLLKLEPELVKQRDNNGFTAVHLATISNNTRLLELLLKYNGDLSEKDNDGHTCLHWAVVCCTRDIIELISKNKPELINYTDNFGASPLHYATQSFLGPEGTTEGPNVLRDLLAMTGVNVDCVDNEGRTPLLWASSLGITDCCSILLSSGANLDHRDMNGLLALHCAASRGNYDVVDLLVSSNDGIDVDCQDNNLCTPLFYAVTLKHLSIIHYLLDKQSNPNQQDIKGRSVAHCAALKGYIDILDLIRKKGGSLCLKNYSGDLPLHEAVNTGNYEVCQMLLDKMQECNELELIDDLNNDGFSPLHLAAQNNHHNICRLLLEYGANLEIESGRKIKISGQEEEICALPIQMATDSSTIMVLKNHKLGVLSSMNNESNIIDQQNENVIGDDKSSNNGDNIDRTNNDTLDSSILKRSVSLQKDPINSSYTDLLLLSKRLCHSCGNLSFYVNKDINEKEVASDKCDSNQPNNSDDTADKLKLLNKRKKLQSPKISSRSNVGSGKSKADLESVGEAKGVIVGASKDGLDRNNSSTTNSSRSSATTRHSNGKINSNSTNKKQGAGLLSAKPKTIQSKVYQSVKEYLETKRKMQEISDRRKAELFHGYNKSLIKINDRTNHSGIESNRMMTKHRAEMYTSSNGTAKRVNQKTISTPTTPKFGRDSTQELPSIYVGKPGIRQTNKIRGAKSDQRENLDRLRSTYSSNKLILL